MKAVEMATRSQLASLCACLSVAGSGLTGAAAAEPPSRPECDVVPTGVASRDHWLHFKLPPGLMPDAQFEGRPAKLQVHRVRPVYAHGKCAGVRSRAAVLIHGRTVPGPAVFDLRDPVTGGGELSVDEGLRGQGSRPSRRACWALAARRALATV